MRMYMKKSNKSFEDSLHWNAVMDAVSSCISSVWSIRVGVKNAGGKKQPTNQTLKQQQPALQLELQT